MDMGFPILETGDWYHGKQSLALDIIEDFYR